MKGKATRRDRSRRFLLVAVALLAIWAAPTSTMGRPDARSRPAPRGMRPAPPLQMWPGPGVIAGGAGPYTRVPGEPILVRPRLMDERIVVTPPQVDPRMIVNPGHDRGPRFVAPVAPVPIPNSWGP